MSDIPKDLKKTACVRCGFPDSKLAVPIKSLDGETLGLVFSCDDCLSKIQDLGVNISVNEPDYSIPIGTKIQ